MPHRAADLLNDSVTSSASETRTDDDTAPGVGDGVVFSGRRVAAYAAVTLAMAVLLVLLLIGL